MSGQEMVNELKKRGFWEFNIGHAIMIASLFGAFLVWWQSFGSLPRETAKALGELAAVVDKMNEKGTFASQKASVAEESNLKSLETRVIWLERNDASLNEKLSEIQAKLNVVAALLEEDKRTRK